MQLDILFRSCSRVLSHSRHERVLDLPNGTAPEKSALILTCLFSLVRSIAALPLFGHTRCPIRLTVLDDRSDPACLAAMQSILDRLAHQPNLTTQILPIAGTGNTASLISNYQFARDHCPDLIYFVEDDYLHDLTALPVLLDSYGILQQGVGSDPILHPCDCPNRYHAPYSSFVFLGSDRHWRTILHTTGTFLVPRAVLLRFWENYMAFAERCAEPGGAEEGTINAIYQTVPCLSPLPALAVHLQDNWTLSPLVDWPAWWHACQGYRLGQ